MEVLGAQDPFVDRYQGGELVAGAGRVPGLPGYQAIMRRASMVS